MQTSLGPSMENYNFLGGLGLLIAGFGGHAIIPSLAIDMKSPEKFDRVVNWAFVSYAKYDRVVLRMVN